MTELEIARKLKDRRRDQFKRCMGRDDSRGYLYLSWFPLRRGLNFICQEEQTCDPGGLEK